jgi:hypothetical protein
MIADSVSARCKNAAVTATIMGKRRINRNVAPIRSSTTTERRDASLRR